jgi:hypothetical protein
MMILRAVLPTCHDDDDDDDEDAEETEEETEKEDSDENSKGKAAGDGSSSISSDSTNSVQQLELVASVVQATLEHGLPVGEQTAAATSITYCPVGVEAMPDKTRVPTPLLQSLMQDHCSGAVIYYNPSGGMAARIAACCCGCLACITSSIRALCSAYAGHSSKKW